MNQEAFADWLRGQREARGLSKTECAKRVGVSVQRWAQIESGVPRRVGGKPARLEASTVERIATALGIPPAVALEKAGYLRPGEAEGPVKTLVLCELSPDGELTPTGLEYQKYGEELIVPSRVSPRAGSLSPGGRSIAPTPLGTASSIGGERAITGVDKSENPDQTDLAAAIRRVEDYVVGLGRQLGAVRREIAELRRERAGAEGDTE